jgi:hypothetical protein
MPDMTGERRPGCYLDLKRLNWTIPNESSPEGATIQVNK